MIVRDYLEIGKGLSPEEILTQARTKLRSTNLNTDNFSDLQEYLNNIFYPKTSLNNNTNKIAEIITKHYSETLNKTLETFDFKNNFFSMPTEADKIDIGSGEKISFSHSKYIELNTIQQRLSKAKYVLESVLPYSLSPAKDFQKIKDQLENLVKQIELLLNNYSYSLTPNGTKIFKINDKNRNLIDQIDNLYKQVSFISKIPLTNDEAGKIFERALTAVGDGKTIDELTDEELLKYFDEKTKGSMPVSRGGLIQLKGISYKQIEKKSRGKTKETYIRYEIQGENGSSFEIGGEFDDRQGKMDVLFTMPSDNPQPQFKISAKNWSAINKRDFGSIDLESGLMRSGGFSNTIGFGVYVGFSRSHQLEAVHNYAKICVILDILMGYSQETHYADTVVINDRENGQIRVFSIEQILNNIIDKKYNSLNNYPPNLRNDIRVKFNTKKRLGAQAYESIILSTLKSYKLTLSASALP